MHHGIFLPPFGELADPRRVAALATVAEEHGWDGLFLWDHMTRPAGQPQVIADPWITLAAVATATRRLRLGTMVTPLARRRPQKVARETVTLDHLSGGRLTLGVGLGVDSGGELERFGECTDERQRAALLDEALALVLALWSGEEVDHRGPSFHAHGVRFLPRPLQSPRIPVWAAARGTTSRRSPLARAARLDGLFPVYATLEELEWMVGVVADERGTLEGYDVAVEVEPLVPLAGTAHLAHLERLGTTWAMRSFGVDVTEAAVLALVRRRPTEV